MFWYGIQVAIVGILVVFFGLALLIGCIVLLSRFAGRPGKKEAPASAPVTIPKFVAEPEEEEEIQEESDEGELVAVISAAVAAMLEAEQAQAAEPDAQALDGFVVRSIRRVGSAPAWNRAGREEQVYSRL